MTTPSKVSTGGRNDSRNLYFTPLNKYGYTSGDPILFGDPTGRFEGLVGLLSSMTIQSGNRGKHGVAAGNAYHKVQRLENLIDFIQSIVEIAVNGYNGGVFGIVESLIGVDPKEVTNIYKVLEYNSPGLTNLSISALAAFSPIDFKFGLPKPGGKRGKLAKAIKGVYNILGKSNATQEFIGELGTGLIARIMNFEDPGLKPAHKVHGPDFILRHHQRPEVWAVMEAKGGRSKLGRSGLTDPPAGMSSLSPSATYKQMEEKWIEYWIRKTLKVNEFTQLSDDLEDAFDPGKPLLTAVVNLNLNRQKEVKFGAQVFVAPFGTLFNPWPSHF